MKRPCKKMWNANTEQWDIWMKKDKHISWCVAHACFKSNAALIVRALNRMESAHSPTEHSKGE